MLSPKYAEGALLEKTGATEITLEDDPVAVLILMNVLHLRNREVPRSLEIGHLHSLAMIVDKYDMFPAVMPWANMWIDSFREEIKPISTAKCQQLLGYEKLLAVSWVLEHEDVFCRVARMLVFTASPDENGMLRVNEGEHFEDGLPDAVIGELLPRSVSPVPCLPAPRRDRHQPHPHPG